MTRTDPEIAAVALRAWAGRSGSAVAVASAVAGEDEDEDEDEESQVAPEARSRIWVDRPARLEREEHSGAREGFAVRRGETWWRWDPYNGALSNHDDEVGTSIADAAKWILGGLRMVASLRIEPLGAGEVAGRATVRCRAQPRASAGDDSGDWVLHRLPAYGADGYELDIDSELGLILRVAGTLDGTIFCETEVVELGIDEIFADGTFVFAAPDGAPVRSAREIVGHRHHHLRPDRLLELADFTIFAPRRIPDDWRADLGFSEASAQPPRRPSATLSLHSPDRLRTVQITQVPIDRDGEYSEWDHADPAPWQHSTRDGIRLEWREPLQDWQPARVRLDRDGTRVLIDSTALPATDLLDLAASLTELRSDRPDFGPD